MHLTPGEGLSGTGRAPPPGGAAGGGAPPRPRQALPEDLRLQFEAIGRLRLDERRAIRALLDDLIRQ
ncbi:hypothetical protein ACRCQX_28020, partial [Pseudomonas aeruginosa]